MVHMHELGFLHSRGHILHAELQLAFLMLLALRVAATPPERKERVDPVAFVPAEPMAAKSQTNWTQVEASHGTRSAEYDWINAIDSVKKW